MSAKIVTEVRKGFYLDSVALMRLSQSIAALDGIQEAALMMGTPSNLKIMADAGLLDGTGAAPGGGDLVIGIRADDSDAAEAALSAAVAQLDRPAGPAGGGAEWRPRTLRAAVKALPRANLALISVPGDFAAAEARKAIRRGLHAMIFSDNVALDEEVELKREAQALGVLVMGPDCGTAIINGTPLAFANEVSRGAVGIVGASGTGTQEVSCLIAQGGGGISHAIGVGGRDLKSEVGGISTLMAIDALEADAATRHVVLISKPPPDDVSTRVLDRIAAGSKPATICFIGAGELDMPANARQVFTLHAAALSALGELGPDGPDLPPLPNGLAVGAGRVMGLFAGGTLCAEAQVLFFGAGLQASSNAPVPGIESGDGSAEGHVLLDLGDDQFTQGKPHPMIDPSVRDPALIAALDDADTALILADVVIGHGADADPAGHLAAVVSANARSGGPPVVASVTGTEADPQVRSAQMAKLTAAGIHVAPTNAIAAQWAAGAIAARR